MASQLIGQEHGVLPPQPAPYSPSSRSSSPTLSAEASTNAQKPSLQILYRLFSCITPVNTWRVSSPSTKEAKHAPGHLQKIQGIQIRYLKWILLTRTVRVQKLLSLLDWPCGEHEHVWPSSNADNTTLQSTNSICILMTNSSIEVCIVAEDATKWLRVRQRMSCHTLLVEL